MDLHTPVRKTDAANNIQGAAGTEVAILAFALVNKKGAIALDSNNLLSSLLANAGTVVGSDGKTYAVTMGAGALAFTAQN